MTVSPHTRKWGSGGGVGIFRLQSSGWDGQAPVERGVCPGAPKGDPGCRNSAALTSQPLQAAPAALALGQSRMRLARLPSALSLPRPGPSRPSVSLCLCLPASCPSASLHWSPRSLQPSPSSALPLCLTTSATAHLSLPPGSQFSPCAFSTHPHPVPVPVVSPFPCPFRYGLLSSLCPYSPFSAPSLLSRPDSLWPSGRGCLA